MIFEDIRLVFGFSILILIYIWKISMAPGTKNSSLSRIQLYGLNKSTCGYCNQKPLECSESFGIMSSHMSVDDYQALMLLGWRRSGKYFYKPIMHTTCCPAYTIRLKANDFKPSKSQKKVLKGVENFLNNSVVTESKDSTNEVVNLQQQDQRKTITIITEPSSYTEEKFELYKKYQISVHGDEPDSITPKSFTRFLVESPLFDSRFDSTFSSTPSTTTTSTTTSLNTTELPTIPTKYGSYHQLYYLNGGSILIGVGVIDLLPSGVSSVYFFYDPDYKNLVLGKYSVLKEIEFCTQIQVHNNAVQKEVLVGGLTVSGEEKQNKVRKLTPLSPQPQSQPQSGPNAVAILNNSSQDQYYYMGYYIHDCEKMKYKGEYRPSELLCPASFEFQSFDKSVEILKRFIFSPLRPDLAEKRALICCGERKTTTTAVKEQNVDDDVKQDTTTPAVPTSSNTENKTENVDFTPFLPQIPTKHTTTNTSHKFNINELKLDLGASEYIRLNQLTTESIQSLTPILNEWVSLCGEDVAKNMVICFN